jgi:hypothetical protein
MPTENIWDGEIQFSFEGLVCRTTRRQVMTWISKPLIAEFAHRFIPEMAAQIKAAGVETVAAADAMRPIDGSARLLERYAFAIRDRVKCLPDPFGALFKSLPAGWELLVIRSFTLAALRQPCDPEQLDAAMAVGEQMARVLIARCLDASASMLFN